MAFTDTWDATFETKPDDNNYGYEVDNYIRRAQTGIRERFEIDHYMDIAGTDADHGMHKKITFRSQEAKPAAVANRGFLYIKDVSAKAELHWEDEDGHELAITSGGALNISALLLTHLATIYPIGCIYTTTVSTNPATVFGFGTWTAFGAGKVLVGLNAADADFDTAEETGGAKTVAGAAHAHDTTIPIAGYGGAAEYIDGYMQTDNSGNVFRATTSPVATSTSVAHSATSVVQPYIVVYFWKRTA